MDLDYDVYWCAVKGPVSVAEVVPRAWGPHASLRAPRSACRPVFTKGEWTFFVAPRDLWSAGTLFPDREVVELSCDSRNSWTGIAHRVNGVVDWSVEDCERAPILIGNAVTGFRHDKHERPRGFQIVEVQPPRELIVPGGSSVSHPSLTPEFGCVDPA